MAAFFPPIFLLECGYAFNTAFTFYLLSTSQQQINLFIRHFFCCFPHSTSYPITSCSSFISLLHFPQSLSFSMSKDTPARTKLTLLKLHGKIWLKVNKRYWVREEAFIVLTKDVCCIVVVVKAMENTLYAHSLFPLSYTAISENSYCPAAGFGNT